MQVSVSQEKQKARAQLRKELREARRSLPDEQHEEAAQCIAAQLNTLPFVKSANTVAGYLVNDGEVNLKYYIESTWQLSHKKFALPVLHPVCKGHLLFLDYTPHSQLINNKYNIEEPVLSCENVIPVTQFDVILMPLVGFDTSGNRLGMGGGYYDRTLSFTQRKLNTQSALNQHNPKLVGIAHDVQEVDALPIAPWDVPLDAIVTPSRTLIFTKP
ncbi:5-formyltetrahydrofolate cyclo-ligase [Alteromonas sp. BL110]|uniref:5-formyltetrahydrofolate cyclo-ligase n=1 Tax=Alteromonas sp. BL110 TaxID=1714845 RepID=UPI000E486922|nr:5-formyltetrahydrofolate cyclo-ligase [Alteromonas sp. BL110]AXT39512.1 5-formyltetrahydrofolate cyclo-ligase [Alteromonas sp. BL110]RKM82002.1 5-formyltetrahydrofolate cyclo-ligase [Alteromonas sp. BL110]